MMGNYVQCKFYGKGTIQINTYNGVVRTLSNVRYIPDLKRNLISLDTLEENGCKHSIEGVLKVSKGAIILTRLTDLVTYMFCKGFLLQVSLWFLCHPYQTQMLPSYGT